MGEGRRVETGEQAGSFAAELQDQITRLSQNLSLGKSVDVVIPITYQEVLQSSADDITGKADRNEIEHRTPLGLAVRCSPDDCDPLLTAYLQVTK